MSHLNQKRKREKMNHLAMNDNHMTTDNEQNHMKKKDTTKFNQKLHSILDQTLSTPRRKINDRLSNKSTHDQNNHCKNRHDQKQPPKNSKHPPKSNTHQKNENRCHLTETAKKAKHTESVFIQNQTNKTGKKNKPTIITSCNPPNSNNSTEETIIHVKPLLILDLNGILCHRLRHREIIDPDIYHISSKPKESLPITSYRPMIGKVAYTSIIPRIDLDSFLHYLDTHFTLAIWSSAKERTVKALTNLLIPHEIRNRLLFTWGQKKCKPVTPQMSIGENKPKKFHPKDMLFIKALNKVWAAYPLWNSHNSLLMDDSPEKCPPPFDSNCIHPPSIQGLIPSTQDVINEEQQKLFFQELVQFWNREKKDDEKAALYQFLDTHGKGHMGWRGSILKT